MTRPCLHCGYCCRKAPCLLATGSGAPLRMGPCPFITEKNLCGLYEKVKPEYREYVEKSLAFGAGCCMPMNSDRAALASARADRPSVPPPTPPLPREQ